MMWSALMFDPAEWGTVADWTLGIIIGLTTAVFAGLAWWQAKQATRWARRAALAEENANNIAEAGIEPKFDIDLDSVYSDPCLRFSVSRISPSVWLHSADIVAGFFLRIPLESYPSDARKSRGFTHAAVVEEGDIEFHRGPTHLRPNSGDYAIGNYDFSDLLDGYVLQQDSMLKVDVYYSITPDGPTHTLRSVLVDLSKGMDYIAAQSRASIKDSDAE